MGCCCRRLLLLQHADGGRNRQRQRGRRGVSAFLVHHECRLNLPAAGRLLLLLLAPRLRPTLVPA
jgi:hypothetical protein